MHLAFYRLTVRQRDDAWQEVKRLRRWLEHIECETGDDEDCGAFARDMARRALNGQ